MSGLKHIWFIMLKDLRLFAKDRLALAFFLLFPFFFVVLFYFLMGNVGTQDKRLDIHLVTRETSGLSQQIISAMETKDESQLQPGQPRIVWDKDYEPARQAVADKKLTGFILFPEDFTTGVLMGYGAQLEVIADPEAADNRAALNGLAQSIALQVGAQQVIRNTTIGLLVEQALASGSPGNLGRDIQSLFTTQPGGATPPSLITYKVEKVGDVQASNPSNYVIPGYLVMFVFFGAALSAEVIVRERHNQTLERLLSSSVRRESIIGGIYAGIAAKGLIQIVIFWLVGIFVFHIDLGSSPGAVILLSIIMVVMSAAFAIMLATLARTERSAGSAAVITSLVFAPLGGCWWPLFITPRWMQTIAKIIPHGWATTGFNKLMLFGGDFGSAVPEMLALLGFAIVFGIIAFQRFRTSPV